MNIRLLHPLAKIPTRGTAGAAGYDLYACNEKIICIPPHQSVIIDTGVAIELEPGTFGGVFSRSGLAAREGLRITGGTSVIDEDFRDSVKVPLYNDSEVMRVIEPGERIAQLVILPYKTVDFNVVHKLSKTERGSKGFGSTGKE